MTTLADTPAGSIARLDAALARRGQDVTLRRVMLSGGVQTPVDVTVRALVRTVPITKTNTNSLIGSIDQIHRTIILSPTSIAYDAWPWPIRKDDTIITKGVFGAPDTPYNVEYPMPFESAGVLVRIELMVKGG